jgi:peptide deformylase
VLHLLRLVIIKGAVLAVRNIVIWPAKVLETPAVPVTKFDEELKQFVADMHETMDDAGGIGLAANQVGDLRRVLAIHIPFADNRYENDEADQSEKQWWHNEKFTFINPVITKRAGKIRYQEGCLSFPDIFENVDRAHEVWVDALDPSGKPFSVHAEGLLSICLQHEIDHIDGVVFIKRMSRLKSNIIRKKMVRRGTETEMESV